MYILLASFVGTERKGTLYILHRSSGLLTVSWYNMNHRQNVISETRHMFILHKLHFIVMHFVV